MSDKQWGHGYHTGKTEAEKKAEVVIVVVAGAAVAVGVAAKMAYDKWFKK